MRPVIFVHGYNFDPASAEDNPTTGVYQEWSPHLTDRPLVKFTYYSAGGSKWRALLGAWTAGYRNTYRWAYSRLAIDAAGDLFRLAYEVGPCDVICHSLGSRVVLRAAEIGAPFNRVVILGGAEMEPVARTAAVYSPDTRYLNVMSTEDDVLDLMAEHFTPGEYRSAIGHDGLRGLPNWQNAVLNDPDVQKWGLEKGWTLKGDLDGFMDHNVYYRWARNWSLYRAFLDGADLIDIPDKATGVNNAFID